MILTVTLNPALDKTVLLPMFAIGQVNRIDQMRLDPGGKGINVSKVIGGLGGKSVAMGILGGATGRYIQQCLDEMGLENDFVFVKAPTRTNLKIIDPKLGTNTDINEPGAPVTTRVIRAVLSKVKARLSPGDTVVLAGKAPAGAGDDLFAQWIKELAALGAKVCIDADGPLLEKGVAAGPALIKPNEEEFFRLAGRRLSSVREIAGAALALNREGIGQIAVSLGEKGGVFVKDGRAIYARGLKVPVKSTVGAGDATMAALVLGNEQGMPWEETIRMAIGSGAASVMCEGTQAVSREAVDELGKQVMMEEICL